jgi:hypothetical protein
MASSSCPNFYASTALQLQTVSNLTAEAKIYHEAVQDVLSRPENKKAGDDEKALVLRRRTLSELQQEIRMTRGESSTLRQKKPGGLMRLGKGLVTTLIRFESSITSMAQSSLLICSHRHCGSLTLSQKPNLSCLSGDQFSSSLPYGLAASVTTVELTLLLDSERAFRYTRPFG